MESLLESLSHAVAELTGLAPTASYYAVLVAIVCHCLSRTRRSCVLSRMAGRAAEL